MANTQRTIERRQNATYVAGSKAKGFYQFSIDGIERVNTIHVTTFSLEGERCETQQEAKASAWKAAREWVAKIGEVVKTDYEYKSEAN